MNRGAHAIAALSGEPGIAAAPAPRASPGLLPVAASRLVTGLSRASCRDASGLAVLMSPGRRAALPGLSAAAAPAPPAGQGRAHHRPGPSDRHLLPPPAAAVRAAGYREHRGLSQPAHQSRSREWTAARQVGRGDTPGCLVGCPGLFPGPRPTRQSGLQAMFLWRGREGSLGAGCSRIARGRRGGCLLVTSTPCPAGHGLYYRRAAELFGTATRGMRGGRRTVRR
jgi:hypothetical protein